MNARHLLTDLVLYVVRTSVNYFAPSFPSPAKPDSLRATPAREGGGGGVGEQQSATTRLAIDGPPPSPERCNNSKFDRIPRLLYAINVTVTIIGYIIMLASIAVMGNYIHGRLSHEYYRSCNSSMFAVMFFKNSMYCHVINICVSILEINVLNLARLVV